MSAYTTPALSSEQKDTLKPHHLAIIGHRYWAVFPYRASSLMAILLLLSLYLKAGQLSPGWLENCP